MKGSIFDIPFIAIGLTVLAIGILVAATIMGALQTQTAAVMDSPAALNAMSKGVEAVNTFNYVFAFIFAGLGFSSLAYAFLVPSHPIFIIAGVIMLLVSVAIIPILSNVYEEFSQNDEIKTATASFGLIDTIMMNLPLLMTVLGALLLIFMYTRYSSSQGTI